MFFKMVVSNIIGLIFDGNFIKQINLMFTNNATNPFETSNSSIEDHN